MEDVVCMRKVQSVFMGLLLVLCVGIPAHAQNPAPLTLDLGGVVPLELVWIPPGEFLMGSPDHEAGRDKDEAQHPVTLTKGLWMGKYEVTQAQWNQVMESDPSHFKGARNPVENVSWNDCRKFLDRLNERPELKDRQIRARLPTEAEWEYACRAGAATRFNTGDGDDDLARAAWYKATSGGTTHPVGQKTPNAWGLHDMRGNVWEWCQDWYGPYPAGSVTNPAGPPSGPGRVMRGASWTSSFQGYLHSACRGNSDPSFSLDTYGFRVVVER